MDKKKNANTKKNVNKNMQNGIIIAVSVVIVAVIIAVCVFFGIKNKNKENLQDNLYVPSQTLADLAEGTFAESESKNNSSSVEIHTNNKNNKKPNKQTGTSSSFVPKKETVIDDTIKILAVGDYGGKFSVTVENISKEDIEYAVLSCKIGKKSATFKLTGLLAGKKAVAVCNEDIKLEKNIDIKNWSIENKLFYNSKRSLNSDIFELKTQNGSIDITNKSDKDIEGTIFICYKEVNDGIFFANDTFRVRAEGLKSGETKNIPASRYTQGVHEIIFVDYGN